MLSGDEIDEVIVEDSSDGDVTCEKTSTFENVASTKSSLINQLATMVVKFLLIFRVVHNIPDKAIVILLKFFKYLFASFTEIHETSANGGTNIPQSIYTWMLFFTGHKRNSI